MKKFFIIIWSLLIETICFSQQIPNGNFESWINSNTAEGWSSSLEVGTYPLIYTIEMAENSTLSFDGIYAAKLETKSTFDYTIPGLIQLGELQFSDENLSITGGLPFADRPLGLSAYVKYFPVENDTAFIISYMTKYNDVTFHTDTISMTFYPIFGTISDYQEILIPYVYLSEEICDTINILFISSNPLNSKVGSTLFVDNVILTYDFSPFSTLALPATELTDTSFVANWFPSPMSENYRIDVATDVNFSNILPEYNDLIVNSYSLNIFTESKTNNFYYRVRVDYDSIVSPNSNVIEVVQNLPANCINATNVFNNSFTANWTTQDLPQYYNLYVATDTTFSNIVTGFDGVNVGQNEFYDVIGLNSNEKYYYKVQSFFETGNNPFSNIIRVQTDNIGMEEFNQINYIIQNKSIKFSNLPYSKISIFDLSGNIIFSSNIFNEKTIEIENSGIYIIEISSNIKTYKFKIYIQ